MIIKDIPYISQWDEEAKASKNDCGPVSLTMILRKYGEKHTADEIFKKTGAGQGYVTFQQLINVAKSLGYSAEYRDRQTTKQLKAIIDQGVPVIALVQYGKLKSVQDKTFKGPHLLVVTGYRDDGYFCNDPNFWSPSRNDGNYHLYTNAEFENAWSGTTTDGNTPNAFLVVYPKVTQPITPPPSLSDQDKKDIESMKKLREYNGVFYEAKHVIEHIDLLKKERDNLGKEISKKDGEIKQLTGKIGQLTNQLEALELNVENRVQSEVDKMQIDCNRQLSEQQNALMVEYGNRGQALHDKIKDLEDREPTEIIKVETPLDERFAKKRLKEKIIACIDILFAKPQ